MNVQTEDREKIIHWRRHLHMHPELSFQETATSQFVFEELQKIGTFELSRPTPTSVLAKLSGNAPGKVLAIRADMDALPIDEENKFEFASKTPGVMHACGHDGHTAMLLGAAKLLYEKRDQLAGEVRFIFQHAEEHPPGGAEELIEAGVMDGVDFVIGTHLWSPLETGKIGIVYGPMMAAPDTFKVRVIGKGGHAGLPHETVDSIAIAAQIISSLQQIVSRVTDASEQLVLSVTQISGGSADNVIPGSVEFGGTVRSFNESIRRETPGHIERIVKGITEAHRAEYEFEYTNGYRPVINEEKTTKQLHNTAERLYGKDAVEIMKPSMVGEDFSAYQQKAPGCFFFTGAGNKGKGITYPHHHAKFTIDEDSLEIGVNMFVEAAVSMLSGKDVEQ
ncbi:M20 family metallopeptidase [Bacillus sp. FJAT-42376]|uniref:M20 family metallopeptidase n=1 Tax=Bacillus sp. FJAT-42376 TaxID=2014076 RepID=UPI001F156135|nr:M20 family metallopeptidase [Bacillus sp. FJAT-42376]